jgi:hypothetical protein
MHRIFVGDRSRTSDSLPQDYSGDGLGYLLSTLTSQKKDAPLRMGQPARVPNDEAGLADRRWVRQISSVLMLLCRGQRLFFYVTYGDLILDLIVS